MNSKAISVCPIALAVSQEMLKRAEFGFQKYKVNLTRTDLTPLQWITHWQEESMDAAVYAERLKSALKDLPTLDLNKPLSFPNEETSVATES